MLDILCIRGNKGILNLNLDNCGLVWHQPITWTNVHLSSNSLCGIHLRVISQEVLMNLICIMCSEITLLKSHLPEANENLINWTICYTTVSKNKVRMFLTLSAISWYILRQWYVSKITQGIMDHILASNKQFVHCKIITFVIFLWSGNF